MTGTIDGVHSTAWALMPAGAADVLVLAGTSFTSVECARANLATEMPFVGSPLSGGGGGGGGSDSRPSASMLSDWFDTWVNHSKQSWSEVFGRVELDGDTHTRELAYTALCVVLSLLSFRAGQRTLCACYQQLFLLTFVCSQFYSMAYCG